MACPPIPPEIADANWPTSIERGARRDIETTILLNAGAALTYTARVFDTPAGLPE